MTESKSDPNSWKTFFWWQVYLFATLTPLFVVFIRFWPGQTAASWDRVLVVVLISSLSVLLASLTHRLISGRVSAQGFFFLMAFVGNNQIVHFTWKYLFLSKLVNGILLIGFVILNDSAFRWWERRKLQNQPIVLESLPDDSL